MTASWHSDLVDDGTPIDVVADIRFLSSDEGGKTCSVRAIYRPNHNFGSPENRNFYIGQLQIAPGDEIAPGEHRRLAIRFLSGHGLCELLVPGREWRIQEALRLVAIARVVEVARSNCVSELTAGDVLGSNRLLPASGSSTRR